MHWECHHCGRCDGRSDNNQVQCSDLSKQLRTMHPLKHDFCWQIYRTDHAASPIAKVKANCQENLASDNDYRQATGSIISLTSDSGNDEMNGDMEMNINYTSSESFSSSSLSPQWQDENEDSHSMVSSGGLTNTSE